MNDFARAVLGKPVVPLYQNGHNQKVAKCVKASLSLTLLHFFALTRVLLLCCLPPGSYLICRYHHRRRAETTLCPEAPEILSSHRLLLSKKELFTHGFSLSFGGPFLHSVRRSRVNSQNI